MRELTCLKTWFFNPKLRSFLKIWKLVNSHVVSWCIALCAFNDTFTNFFLKKTWFFFHLPNNFADQTHSWGWCFRKCTAMMDYYFRLRKQCVVRVIYLFVKYMQNEIIYPTKKKMISLWYCALLIFRYASPFADRTVPYLFLWMYIYVIHNKTYRYGMKSSNKIQYFLI